MINVAVIGLGHNGLAFCERYSRNSKSNLVGVCDIDEACRDKLCLTRGSVVYCVKEADNPEYEIGVSARDMVKAETIQADTALSALPQSTVILRTYSPSGEKRFTAVPYHLWDNRAHGRMDVWLPEIKDLDVRNDRLYQ